jgi:hypothetical protein
LFQGRILGSFTCGFPRGTLKCFFVFWKFEYFTSFIYSVVKDRSVTIVAIFWEKRKTAFTLVDLTDNGLRIFRHLAGHTKMPSPWTTFSFVNSLAVQQAALLDFHPVASTAFFLKLVNLCIPTVLEGYSLFVRPSLIALRLTFCQTNMLKVYRDPLCLDEKPPENGEKSAKTGFLFLSRGVLILEPITLVD